LFISVHAGNIFCKNDRAWNLGN
jgi:hypothetical protein